MRMISANQVPIKRMRCQQHIYMSRQLKTELIKERIKASRFCQLIIPQYGLEPGLP